jgi:hypothetical protein
MSTHDIGWPGSIDAASLRSVQAIPLPADLLAGANYPLVSYLAGYRVAGTPAYRLDGAVLFHYDYWRAPVVLSRVAAARRPTDRFAR